MNQLTLYGDQRFAANLASERPRNIAPEPKPGWSVSQGEIVPMIWGSSFPIIDVVPWDTRIAETGNRAWPRRCLVAVESLQVTDTVLGGDGVAARQFAGDNSGDPEWFYLAGVWWPVNDYGTRPHTFSLLSQAIEGINPPSRLLTVPRALSHDWLNPARDAVRLIRRFGHPEPLKTRPTAKAAAPATNRTTWPAAIDRGPRA